MPIHIYQCDSCGKREDYLVKQDQQAPNCYSCGEDGLFRIWEGQTFAARASSDGDNRKKSNPKLVTGIGLGFPDGPHVGIGIKEGNEIQMKDLGPIKDKADSN